MIVHDFVLVTSPEAEVKRTVRAGLGLLEESATHAYASGERLRRRVGPGGPHGLVAKSVVLKIGEPIVHGDATTIPVLWEALGTPSLFPRMDASLEIAPLGASLTQVSFYGRYDPPLGRVGEGLDRLLLHRLAEHTVRAFLHEIAVRVAAAVSAHTS